jgi:O-antigen ligase
MVREALKDEITTSFIGRPRMLKIAQSLSDLRQTKFVNHLPQQLNNVIVVLITLFIFAIPFHYNTAIQEICFYTALALASFLVAIRKAPFSLKSPLTVPFALLVMWAFIGLFSALNKENSITDFYGHLLKYLILFYLMVNFFDTKRRFTLIAWILVSSTTIFTFGLIAYFYFILRNPLSVRLLSIDIPVNILSVVTIFPCLLTANTFFRTKYFSLRIILIFCLFTLALSIISTGSRFSVSVLVLSVAPFFITHKKGALLLAIFIIILIFCLPVKSKFVTSDFMNNIKNDPRLFLSNPFVEIIKTHPLTGIGFGLDTYADKKLIEKYNEKLEKTARLGEQWYSSYYYPHSIYIDIAARLGIVGLLIFFYISFAYFRTGWLIMRRSRDDFLRSWSLCLMTSFFALLVIGIFESFLGFSVSVVLYIQYAMMMILWRLYGREQAIEAPI